MISSCSSGFLMSPASWGGLPLHPSSRSRGTGSHATHSGRRQSHHGETGQVCPEPCPGWPCPRPSGS